MNIFYVLDDPESILNETPINIFWRRYHRGINMSDMHCSPNQPQCLKKDLTSISDNHITTIYNKHQVSFMHESYNI